MLIFLTKTKKTLSFGKGLGARSKGQGAREYQ